MTRGPRRRTLLAALCLLPALAVSAESPAPPDTVVLLHGLGRSSSSMRPLADFLEQHGYRVVNLDYPSREKPVAALVEILDERVAACCAEGPGRMHFVTHSLGGILVRAWLAERRPARLGRVVMLAPPNRGSEWVDTLEDLAAFESILGPAAGELGTDAESVPNQLNRLGPVDYPLGVLAGTGSVNPLADAVVPEPNDGTVSVDRTRAPGMRDFRTVPASHTFIMQEPEAMREVLHFLRHGRFSPSDGGA